MNVDEIYSKLSPDQRAQLAKELVNGMGGTSQNVDLNNPTPQQMAALHEEAKQKNPALLDRIRKHPLLTGVLAGVAAFELDRHFGKG